MTDTKIYKQCDGLRYELELRSIDNKEEFPQNSDKYASNFENIENYLNDNVHKEVGLGATLHGNGLQTDHGEEHVAMVINRGNLLLEDKVKELTGYELYILLLAMHFHDVGNIYGREKHEQKILKVMDELGDKLPLDNASKAIVADIASAHGGYSNDSKDTISSLMPKQPLNGKWIRSRALAAILRFADEIAEDGTRACRFLLEASADPKKVVAFL